jgi:hypothetical protein
MRSRHAIPLLAGAALLSAACGSGRPTAVPAPSSRVSSQPSSQPSSQLPGPANAVVATVNGAPIELGEFRLTLAKDESAAYDDFRHTGGTADGPAFWTTPLHGQRPLDWLKQRALTDAEQDKAAQLLGQQHQIAPVLDYPTLVADLAAENQRREAAISQNQPVYGPQQLDLAEFYDSWLSNLKMRIIATGPAGAAQQTDQSYATLLQTTVKAAKLQVDQGVYDAINTADLGA